MLTKLVEMDGKWYRIRSIPAYYAQKFLSKDPSDVRDFDEGEVIYLMSFVDAKIDGNYIPLEDSLTIDVMVDDWLSLDRLVNEVYDFNFSFMADWKMWRVPSVNDFVGSEPRQLSPFIHAIITQGYATLSELKSTCSLRDAFEMQDSILTKAMNEYRYSQMRGM